MRFALPVAMMLVLAAPLSAQDEGDCTGSGDEMRHCTEMRFQDSHEVMMSYVADAEDAIARYEARLPPHLHGLGDEFRAAQEAWQAYTDAQCKAVAALYRGGNREPMRELECLTEMAVARVYEIDFLLEEMQQ